MSLIGHNAPDFTLLDQNRESLSLNGLRGQKIVLAFFPAAFTGVCQKELCTFRDSLASFNEINATVIGICVDAPFSNAAFASANDLNFPVLSDYSRSTVRAYGIALDDFAGMAGYTASQRAVFIVGTDGRIIYEWIGPNPGVEPDYDEVFAALN